MYITKSIFIEFLKNPKLARRHINDQKIYNKINDKIHWSVNWLEAGKAMENTVLNLYKNIKTINNDKIDFNNWHDSYNKLTQKIISEKPNVIYQWWFTTSNKLFNKPDLLVLNENWKYDIIEIKSKNSIRKNTKQKPLLEWFQYDISFQNYVTKKVLWNLFSWKIYIAYLNKNYIKHWEIDIKKLIIFEDVSNEILEDNIIEKIIYEIKQNIHLDKNEFEKKYPYDWKDYTTYFWEKKPKDSIRNIPNIWKKIFNYYPYKTKLKDFTNDDIKKLYNLKWKETKASDFVKLRKQWITTINKNKIKKILKDEFIYPLFFYDYETISRPIPIFEWTKPWQQVIVQYSMHKIDLNWKITHKQAIISHWENNNEKVINQLINDFEWWKWTYIVRYKWFENNRNKELAENIIYKKYKDILERVNKNTFDLMEIFSKQLYFDRRFQWSSSIKKVLPVMTEISYKNMNVSNWWIATNLLYKISQWLIEKKISDKNITDLLEYCKQDSRAMVRIRQELKKI